MQGIICCAGKEAEREEGRERGWDGWMDGWTGQMDVR